jgi:tetratricopeptide (TPR) repeat protein
MAALKQSFEARMVAIVPRNPNGTWSIQGGITRKKMYRKLPIGFLSAALLAATLPAAAQSASKGAACVEASEAVPERVIADCDVLLSDKTTADAKLPSIFLARAEAFVRQEHVKLAIDDLGNVVERRPDNARAFLRRAELQRTLGETDDAIRDFTSVIRLEPRNVAAVLARADLYRAKTDRRRALADYAAVLRLDPANEAASASYKALALEIERLGAMMPVQK